MGTDRVKLFDKHLADTVLAMNRSELEAFITERADSLQAKQLYCYLDFTVPLRDAIDKVLSGRPPSKSEAEQFAEFRQNVALDLALGEQEIAIDYWGCYCETLMSATGMLSCMDYMRFEEEVFLLLLPEHVDLMLASLREHATDLNIMGPAEVQELQHFRDHCRENADYRVAYFLDF
jgi:hypothetical protein